MRKQLSARRSINTNRPLAVAIDQHLSIIAKLHCADHIRSRIPEHPRLQTAIENAYIDFAMTSTGELTPLFMKVPKIITIAYLSIQTTYHWPLEMQTQYCLPCLKRSGMATDQKKKS